MINSVGRPVHPDPVARDNFARWFKKSVTLDGSGRPLVLYHGSNKEFDEFNTRVVWVSSDPALASDYAEYKASADMWGDEADVGNAVVLPLYARAEKPFFADGKDPDTIGAFFGRAISQATSQMHDFDHDSAMELVRFIRDCARREESGPYYSTYDFWNGTSFFGRDGDEAIYKLMKLLGFDSVKFTENGVTTFGLLDPSAVKSALSNSGAFSDSCSLIDRDDVQAVHRYSDALKVIKEFDIDTAYGLQRDDTVTKQVSESALFNSRNKPVCHTLEGTENFKDWYAGSKLLDSMGRPLVAFHGTTRDFDAFDLDTRGQKTGALDAQSGFFFAENPSAADEFTWESGEKSGHIMPVYLKMERPYFSDHHLTGATGTFAGRIIQDARRAGYDGVVFGESDMLGHKGATYVVFDPLQVKSAVGNSGVFDPNSTDLTDRQVLSLGLEQDESERMRSRGSKYRP